jgi:hypothetical protein
MLGYAELALIRDAAPTKLRQTGGTWWQTSGRDGGYVTKIVEHRHDRAGKFTLQFSKELTSTS